MADSTGERLRAAEDEAAATGRERRELEDGIRADLAAGRIVPDEDYLRVVEVRRQEALAYHRVTEARGELLPAQLQIELGEVICRTNEVQTPPEFYINHGY